jgi:hypothetical protein
MLGVANTALAGHRRHRRQASTPAARRKRKERARHKAGFHHYGLWISDRAVEGLILKCIQEQRLTPEQATYPYHIKRAILELLEEEGNRWAR